MKTRLLLLTISIVFGLFLLTSGFFILSVINPSQASNSLASKPVVNIGLFDKDTNHMINNVLQPFTSQKEPITFLLLGGDKVCHNTDTLMLVNINPNTQKISILSIPRDTRANVLGKYEKINAAFPRAGFHATLDSVNNLLGTNIKNYAFVDTIGFKKIIDYLGGVDVYIPDDLKYNDPTQNLNINLKKGFQKLDGNKSEQYMRFRKYNTSKVTNYYDGSDIHRIYAQQNFINEFIRQKANLGSVTVLRDIINTLSNYVETNIDMSDVLRIAGDSNLSQMSKNVNTRTLHGWDYVGESWLYIVNVKEVIPMLKNDFELSVNMDIVNSPTHPSNFNPPDYTRNKPVVSTPKPSNSIKHVLVSSTPVALPTMTTSPPTLVPPMMTPSSTIFYPTTTTIDAPSTNNSDTPENNYPTNYMDPTSNP